MTSNISNDGGKQIQITITVGIGHDRNHKAISEDLADKVCREVATRITALFGGVTVREVSGLFRMADGSVVTEPSVEFVVLVDIGEGPAVLKLTPAIVFAKAQLNQECVLLAASPVSYQFI